MDHDVRANLLDVIEAKYIFFILSLDLVKRRAGINVDGNNGGTWEPWDAVFDFHIGIWRALLTGCRLELGLCGRLHSITYRQ